LAQKLNTAEWNLSSERAYDRMDKSFTIEFDFPLEHSEWSIPITAIAEFNQHNEYYKVHSFGFSKSNAKEPSLMPVQYIKAIKENGRTLWVDRDSGRFAPLIDAIGKSIESKENQK